MKETLYYIQSIKNKTIIYKCFDKEETLKFIKEERIDPKFYQMKNIQVDMGEFLKVRAIDMPNYLNKQIRKEAE